MHVHTYTRTRTRGSPSHWRMRVCERNRVSVHDSIPFISFLTCAPGDERARSTCARGLTYEWDDLNAEDRTPLFFERYKKKIGKNFLPCNPFAILFFFPSKKLLVSFEYNSTCTRCICRTVYTHTRMYIDYMYVYIICIYVTNM